MKGSRAPTDLQRSLDRIPKVTPDRRCDRKLSSLALGNSKRLGRMNRHAALLVAYGCSGGSSSSGTIG
jgi:hypothetical protein